MYGSRGRPSHAGSIYTDFAINSTHENDIEDDFSSDESIEKLNYRGPKSTSVRTGRKTTLENAQSFFCCWNFVSMRIFWF